MQVTNVLYLFCGTKSGQISFLMKSVVHYTILHYDDDG